MTLGLFADRPAWQISSAQLRVSVMECGGHVAETTLLAGGTNPLWIQNRPTIDSDQYDPALHAERFGNDGESKLLAGLLGHNLCMPFWGLASPAEHALGMTCHGESNFVRWQEWLHQSDRLIILAELPRSALQVRRELYCRDNLVFFRTTVKNLLLLDRPLAWCEHVTYGPPFLATPGTFFGASLGKGFITSRDPEQSFHWPTGRGEQEFDLRQFAAEPHAEFVNSFVVETHPAWAWFAAVNRQLGLLFGYAFPAAQFPWLNVWQSNSPERRTRGMEFSNTPVEGSMKQLFATPEVYGLPTFEWLEAGASITKEFVSFSQNIPQSSSQPLPEFLTNLSLDLSLIGADADAWFKKKLKPL